MAGLQGHKITAVTLVPLLILLPLTMLSSMASATPRSPAAVSGEGFAVLREVPTGPSNETSDQRRIQNGAAPRAELLIHVQNSLI